MKQLLLICAVVALVGCHAGNKGAEEAKVAAKAKAIAEARAAAEAKAAEANATVTPKPEAVSVVTVTIADPIVEKAIRKSLKKPTGELTEADLEKVTGLDLYNNQLTDVKDLEKLPQLKALDLSSNKLTSVNGLEKLTQLTMLNLEDNPDLAKAQIAGLKKALPKCRIHSNPTK